MGLSMGALFFREIFGDLPGTEMRNVRANGIDDDVLCWEYGYFLQGCFDQGENGSSIHPVIFTLVGAPRCSRGGKMDGSPLIQERSLGIS